MFMVPCIADLY